MIFKPPSNIATRNFKQKHVFLGGSIEMGRAIDWQADMGPFFDENHWGAFNPRRDNWNPNLVQDFNNPEFFQQVMWELDALEKADIVLMYLLPETMSPISLLEFGLYARSGKIYVICPDGFGRKGNIDITCHKYNVPVFDNPESFKDYFLENKHSLCLTR